MIAEAIRKVTARESLTREEVERVFTDMMDGVASDVQKAAFLVAMRMKGETAMELAGAATVMRERVTRLDVAELNVVDTCGTGGDGSGTFNVSTVSAIVAAAAGANVAKHGNRAVSSSCGSADVLAALGVNLELDASGAEEVLRSTGIAFLFAPKMHPAMSAVVAVRRELGVRTMFNLLGPLTNPAFARRQVLGVFARQYVEMVAEVLHMLGAQHALVVHSDDGLDEISISAPTEVCEVTSAGVRSFRVTPEELGVASHPIEALAGGDAQTNAAIALGVLEGTPGAKRDIVLANAGAALYVSGAAESVRDGVVQAAAAIDSGAAREKLRELVQASQRAGGRG